MVTMLKIKKIIVFNILNVNICLSLLLFFNKQLRY